jgi:GT2 family glycosyltransferase
MCPPKSGVVSIIIPCYNQVTCTRQCVDSIIQNSDGQYELVLVDNGSQDETGAFFSSLEKKSGLPIRIIHNRENKGVSGALNQGIAVATGSYMCYLNNDTLVTRDWLAGLRRCAESDKRIGIVGCCTNPKSGSQNGFSSLDGLRSPGEIQRTATLISLVRRGTVKDVHYVHGFCMFIKREVIQKIGTFDERFFPCGCEDFDYSLRARRAGFRLVQARDVYVYHFHHKSTADRSFSNQYQDIDGVTRNAQRLFIEKWGETGKVFLDELARIIHDEQSLSQ